MRYIILNSILIATMCLSLNAKGNHGHKINDKKDASKKLERFINYLNLSKDQKNIFIPIYKNMKSKSESFHQENNMLKSELRGILKSNPNEQEVIRIHEKLHQIRLNQMNLKYDFLNSASSVLTPNQMGDLLLMDKHNGKKHKKGKGNRKNGKKYHRNNPKKF